MRIRTCELTGAALDWAVAQCENNVGWEPEGEDRDYYSSNWAHGGPIIERDLINVCVVDGKAGPTWEAFPQVGMNDQLVSRGPTPLIAAMRCKVMTDRGEEVDVPEELT